MIGLTDAKRFIEGMPWPEDHQRPVLRMWDSPSGYMVLLHETLSDGWGDVARMIAPTPEAALACALGEWVRQKDLANRPALFDSIKRLTN